MLQVLQKQQSFMNNIIFFSFAKASATSPIYSYSTDSAKEDTLKSEVLKVINQLRNIDLQAQERQKISTNNGCWYCKKDDKEMLYMLLTVPSYNETFAYKGIGELTQHLKRFGPFYNTQQDVVLKNHSKQMMKQIVKKYEVPAQDKVNIARYKAEDLKSEVRSSVRKILSNQVQLQNLEQKSISLRDNANVFSKSATQLQRIMYWRNCKMKIIIGLVVLGILAFILVPIISKATQK